MDSAQIRVECVVQAGTYPKDRLGVYNYLKTNAQVQRTQKRHTDTQRAKIHKYTSSMP